MKKTISIILSIAMLIGTMSAMSAFAETAFAKSEPIIKHSLPETMKIGETFDGEYGGDILVFNMKEYAGYYLGSDDLNGFYYAHFRPESCGDGGIIDENGTGSIMADFTMNTDPTNEDFNCTVYKPGQYSFQLNAMPSNGDLMRKAYETEFNMSFSTFDSWSNDQKLHYDKWSMENQERFMVEAIKRCVNIGDPITVTVEEPVIQTNAPESIKKGSTLTLNTELGNTALQNTDVAYYLDEKNYNYEYERKTLISDATHPRYKAAYQPSVEILEGQDIVKQSAQDYSNTLNSSETLTFTGTGTVKLKVKYNQLITSDSMKYPDGESYSTYSPEKIITIQVTDDNPIVGYTVSGIAAAAVDKNGEYVYKPGFTASLMQGETIVATAKVDPSSGRYQFNGVVPGAYQLVLGGPTAVKTRIDVIVQEADVYVAQINLINCDFNGDGVINYADCLLFLNVYGMTAQMSDVVLGADMNGDGSINYSDYLLFLNFVGKE